METGGKCFYNSRLHGRREGDKIELYKAESLAVLMRAPLLGEIKPPRLGWHPALLLYG